MRKPLGSRSRSVGERRAIIALAGVAVAAVLGALLIATASLAGGSPETPTSETYRSLLDGGAQQSSVRADPAPPSVVGPGPAAPPAPASDGATDAPSERPKAPEAQPTAAPSPTPTPGPPVLVSPVARLRIPRIEVDAPLIRLGLTPAGDQLAAPSGPEEVAWYDFTGKPGIGGNAVLSGHVDMRNYGPAVFAELDRVRDGDTMEIELADGTVIEYTVTAAAAYPLEEINMSEILATTAVESVTLITCGGTWLGSGYSDRVIVRAVRTGVSTAGSS